MREVGALILAALLSFLLMDVIVAFTEAFLPTSDLTIRFIKPKEGRGQHVRILQEEGNKQLFSLLLRDFKSRKETGWDYFQGIRHVSWTYLSSETPGSELSIKVRKDSECFFTVMESRWNSGFEYVVDEQDPVFVECYNENSEGDIFRIYPLENDHTKERLQVVVYLAMTLAFFFLIRSITPPLCSK